MANKAQQIFELSQDEAKRLSDIDNWTSFLTTAAWQYKYPFEDQLLIYAQRPDAKACASCSVWNNKLKRWINRGAKGIALLRENERGHYLDYVFDISDTNSFYGNEVKLWSYSGRFDDEVIETLENTFGTLETKNSIYDAVFSAAHNAVQDAKSDYLSELAYLKGDSFLYGLDKLNIDVEFQQTAEASVAYMIFSRLELPAAMIVEREDFGHIIDFNTPETMAVLGNAVSSISEQALREIAGTIRTAERAYREQDKKINEFFAENEKAVYNESIENTQIIQNDERNEENDRDNIHASGRLQKTELGSADTDGADRQIRNDEIEVFEEQPQKSVLSNENQGNADGTLDGDGQDGERTGDGDSIADGEKGGRDGADESERPSKVDGTDEQLPTRRRRNRNEPPSAQLSLFDLIPTEEEQQNIIREAARNTFGAAFSMPQQIIDELLCDGTHEKDSVIKICVEFSKNKPIAEKADYLKTLYGKDAKGFISGGSKVSALWDSDGIHITYGKSAKNANTVVSWEQAAKRIDELLDMGRYAPTDVLLGMKEFELQEIADRFCMLYREIDYDSYPELKARFPKDYIYHIYPEATDRIKAMLQNPEQYEELKTISEGLAELPKSMFRLKYSAEDLRDNIADLSLERKVYTAESLTRTPPERYITDDEIDRLFTTGSGVSHGKYRTYLFFQKHTDKKEREAFLKEEYGWGGSYTERSNFDHNAKGLTFSHGALTEPYAKVTLTWSEAEKRINKLIQNGNYLSQQDIDNIPEYETGELARVIYYAFMNADNTVAKPYPDGKYLTNAMDSIAKRLTEKPDAADILEALKTLTAETPHTDKDYEYRRTAVENLEQYQNGEYNLFPKLTEYDLKFAAELAQAKRLINEFVQEEYDGHGADFSVLSEVNLAYTTTEDEKHEIQASVDLISCKFERYIDKELIERRSYNNLSELIDKELYGLSFDDLVYVTEEDIAKAEKAQEPPQVKVQTNAPLTEKAFADFFNQIHAEDNGETIALFPVGDFYEAFGDDAEKVAQLLDLHTANKVIDGTVYQMTGFPKHVLEQYVNTLNDSGIDVVLVDEGKQAYKVLSSDKVKDNSEMTADEKEAFVETIELARDYGFDIPEEDIKQYEDITSGQTELLGKELTIDDRKFIVDSVDVEYDNVMLKDITFQKSTGFPIFRSESIDFVNAVIAEQEKPQLEPPKLEKPQKAANTVIYPEIPMSERNNFVITNDELGYGGPKEKFQKNMAAIRVLKECEFDNRLATPEEQAILSEYVGWGGLADAFDETKDNWSAEFKELYETLTPEEYESARASTLTSHFTSPTIIKAMYKALDNMGFSQGNILEPSCGIGNFMGLLPESMADSKIYGIELDGITGRIAQQLYQKNSVAIQGYEDTTLPDSFFDVAIGNVPFGDYKLMDKKYNKHNFLIHDYFFAKTLDKVRPGGVIAFITSSGTMDKQNSKVRQYIAQRADLLGAIRLPNNAFKKNAGTEVTADILFLQKRDRMTDIMPEWVNIGEYENGHYINQYFIDNPDMVMGEMKEVSGPFGPTLTCMPDESTDLAEQLDDAIQNIHAQITEYEFDDISEDEEISIPADPNVKNFSYTLVDGEIYFRENSGMRKVETTLAGENRIKGMIEIRDCVRTLIEYQTEGYDDNAITEQQAKLNTLYDDFTRKYGLINSRGNSMAFSDDSSYFLLCSLEVLNENGELERKADMFTKRTIGAKKEITSVDTADEALAVSLGEKAKVDMDFMQQLTGKTEEELYNDLKGVIYINPEYEPNNVYEPAYLTADEYLSGNVREKLQVVKDIAANDSDYQINVEALEKVQPKDLTASEITVRLGTTWIPPEYIKQFVFELLSPSYYAKEKIELHYSNITGEWSIANKSADKGIKATNTYGTNRINAYRIIEESLNLRDVRIFDYVTDENGNKKAVFNAKETTIAQQKQDAIRQAFDNWIWRDPQRRETLVNLYNERFNSVRPREYDGSHITFSGMNPEIQLRQHQKNAVARIMYGGNSLLGHVVGAGKTWTMVAAAMESRRLGLCNKPLFVVPNHLTEQWASEFLQLYPSANIMVATKKDFEMKNRKKFCGRIATGDYDAVIIGHSQFEKIPMSVERQKQLLERQKSEIMEGIAEAKSNNAERFTIKDLERTKKSIDAKIKKLNDQSRKDDVVTFEELGVDRIFVDEAHYYKNLYLYSKMRNVGGISQTEAQKSSDLFMKTQYLDEITGGKGVIFATGTPISNSMVEMYTMQRYLQYKALEEKRLQHFDAWASTFGETITAIELAPEGTGYRAKTRFAKFFNLPELMSMFKEIADIQTSDMLNLPVPKAEYHVIAVNPTELQKQMVAELAERAERVRNRSVDPSVDNMLKITNDGRKLALDQRMANELLPDDESSKVSECVNNVFANWEKTADIKGTQLVFCDLSTPKKDSFSVYNSVREKLLSKGVPESDIAFIHDADTEVKKKELFSKVRKGDVRILLGSTAKMGAGTNVQTLLYASHDLDCPWRPADLEQRAGRIIRQGNKNDEVHIYRYVTKDTFDSYMWQTVENKQKFISQIMTSKSPVRSAEDIDETALSYAEIKALATGNPYIKEKMELDTEVAKLKVIKSNFMSQIYDLEDKVLKHYPKEISDLKSRIKGLEADLQLAGQHPKQEDKFNPMTIDGLGYYEKEKAGTALIERCTKLTDETPIPVGDYRGFTMILSFDTYYKKFYVSLKNELSHKVELGTDVFGNIQRLDNALERLSERLELTKENLAETEKQFETAKVESKRTFPQEAELSEKLERLAKLDALLNTDKTDRTAVDMSEPEDESPQKKKVYEMAR